MPTTRFITIVIALAIALAGCGDGGAASKQDYERGMRAVAKDFDRASRAAADIPPDVDGSEREAAIRRQQRAMSDAARRAGKLEAPEDVEKHHDKLVDALGEYADLLERYAEASGDSAKEAELLGEAGEIVDDIRAASAALEKAGYEFEAS